MLFRSHFIDGQSAIEKEKVFQLCSIGAPYIDVPEELSPREIISTFSSFKPFINNATAIEILEMLRLKKDADKSVKYFSSGMKQRLKIGMAILSDCPLLLLDEPLSNLDKDGIDWFNELMLDYSQSKTIIVASNNIPEELKFCDKILDISDYKIAN